MTVSHTTRGPRPGEEEGIAYYFISREEFKSLIEQGAFIEHTEFNGNLYGTSWKTVDEHTAKGSTVLLDIEMEGVKQLKKATCAQVDARFVFIRPPSLKVLERQLRGRGTETEESIQQRLARAKDEMEYADTGAHDKIIVNDDLEVALKQLKEFLDAS